jgi:hypothetical protein
MSFPQTNGTAQTCEGTEFYPHARNGAGDAEPSEDPSEDLVGLGYNGQGQRHLFKWHGYRVTISRQPSANPPTGGLIADSGRLMADGGRTY